MKETGKRNTKMANGTILKAAMSTKQPMEKFAEFVLDMPQAKSVAVAGSFNNWKPVTMRKNGDSCWRISLMLPPGRHEYRFVVDGRWIDDPRAAESVPNPFGGRNAILTIKEESVLMPMDLAAAVARAAV